MSTTAPVKSTLYKRSDKVNFMKTSANKYERMTGFTEGGTSLNSKTYDRQYIDEVSERSDVVAYGSAIGYKFDRYTNVTVHNDLGKIHEDELVGQTVEIVTVDFNQPVTGQANQFFGKKRTYSVIPDAHGDETDAYTYSGEFKAAGSFQKVTASSTDGFKTITVVDAN